jgi:sucrose-6-phosphate hydrolase SacC (GH32 family)
MRKLIKVIIVVTLIVTLSSCKKGENDLVGYFPLDEGVGEVTVEQANDEELHIDYVFNEKNASLIYKEPSDPMWRDGVKSNALLFDGYSTYIINDQYNHPTEEFTISLWVAPRAFEWGDEGKFSPFVSQIDSANSAGYLFGMYRHGRWGIQLGLGNSFIAGIHTVMAPEDKLLPTNEWTYLSATFNQEELKLYMNGELVLTDDLGDYQGYPLNQAITPQLIGRHNDTAQSEAFTHNMFSGILDEIKIYNIAKTEEDILDSYNSYLKDETHPEMEYTNIAFDPTIYDGDRNRTQYHAIPGENWMNEPHAPLYFNGMYHLFYQFNPFGPFWHQIHWGHWVSTDMVNWENVDIAVSPHEPVTPDGVWTGSASYDADGNPILFITAGNDSITPNQNVAICRPVDLTDPYLTEWDCDEELAIFQTVGKIGEFRDPFVWQEGDTWYLINGSGTTNGNGGTAMLYTSTDLENWNFEGNFYETDFSTYNYMGANWELPVFLPLKDENGLETDYGIFMVSPHPPATSDVEVYYWIGEFNKTTMKFEPIHEEPRLIDFGDGIMTGPSGFVDPLTGRTIVFTIAQGANKNQQQDFYSGWAHSAGFPISVWIDSESLTLRFEPIEEVENLRGEPLLVLENKTIDEVNQALETIGGDTIEIILEMTRVDAEKAGLYVRQSTTERTDIYYDFEANKLVMNSILSSERTIGFQRQAEFDAENDIVQIHILLDRSLIEIYANDIVSISTRIYPVNGESMGITLYSKNGEVTVNRIEIYEMKSVFTEDIVEPYYEEN